MAQVEVLRPTQPPIESVILTLSEREAHLVRILTGLGSIDLTESGMRALRANGFLSPGDLPIWEALRDAGITGW